MKTPNFENGYYKVIGNNSDIKTGGETRYGVSEIFSRVFLKYSNPNSFKFELNFAQSNVRQMRIVPFMAKGLYMK